MKTILINVFDRGVIKNLIRTDMPSILNRAGIKIVLLVHPNLFEEYNKEFSSEMFIVDKRPSNLVSNIENLGSFIARNSIPTHTVRQIQEEGFDGSGRLPVPRYIVARIVWFLGHFRWFKKFLSFVIPYFFNDKLYEEVIKKYDPDLIFSPTIVTVIDFRILRYARKHHIPTIGIIKSWDNLTSKDSLLFHPDWLIVYNEIVKKEAIEMHNYPKEKIFVSGVPQFDVYSDKDILILKKEFFESLGLDPNKKLITYTAMGSWLVKHEKEIIKMLAEIVGQDKLKYKSQLLVRLHPAYKSEDETLRSIPNIFIDRPGQGDFKSDAWKSDWKFTNHDIKHLVSTLKWSDVNLNCGSTTTIEAAILDTPIINIAFDGKIKEKFYWKSARRLMKRDHCLNILKTNGTSLAKDEESLIKMINLYLANPSLHSEGRKCIAKEQNYKNDGQANKRIGNFLADKFVKI